MNIVLPDFKEKEQEKKLQFLRLEWFQQRSYD